MGILEMFCRVLELTFEGKERFILIGLSALWAAECKSQASECVCKDYVILVQTHGIRGRSHSSCWFGLSRLLQMWI